MDPSVSIIIMRKKYNGDYLYGHIFAIVNFRQQAQKRSWHAATVEILRRLMQATYNFNVLYAIKPNGYGPLMRSGNPDHSFAPSQNLPKAIFLKRSFLKLKTLF